MKIKINRNKNYTTMSNYHLRDKELSLKAKGMMSLMLSLPDEWEYSIDGLTTLSTDGKDSINSALKELENKHYLIRTQQFNDKNKFDGYRYDLYECPYLEIPSTEKPYTENPQTENPPQINKELNKELNNKILNNKENTKESEKESKILELFNEFWDIYPRKVDKKGSYKAFKNIENIIEIAPEIISAVKKHKQTRQWQDIQYIPHPTTYLHQERWETVEEDRDIDKWYNDYWNDAKKEAERERNEKVY